MKKILTLFLVFLIVLVPVGISPDFPLPDVYIGINNGQVQVSSDSCSFSGEVDCSNYNKGTEQEKLEKLGYIGNIGEDFSSLSLNSINEQNFRVSYLICALKDDDEFKGAALVSIRTIFLGFSSYAIEDDNPVNRMIEPLTLIILSDNEDLRKSASAILEIVQRKLNHPSLEINLLINLLKQQDINSESINNIFGIFKQMTLIQSDLHLVIDPLESLLDDPNINEEVKNELPSIISFFKCRNEDYVNSLVNDNMNEDELINAVLVCDESKFQLSRLIYRRGYPLSIIDKLVVWLNSNEKKKKIAAANIFGTIFNQFEVQDKITKNHPLIRAINPLINNILSEDKEIRDNTLRAIVSMTRILEDNTFLNYGGLSSVYKFSRGNMDSFIKIITTFSYINIDFDKLETNEQIIQQIVDKSKLYLSNGGSSSIILYLGEIITIFHDSEGALYGTDSIREGIINGLDFSTIYSLIVSDDFNNNNLLYPSTFEKLYEKINKRDLYSEIRDYNEQSKIDFIINLAKHDKIIDIMDNTQNLIDFINFFGNVFEKNPKNALWFISTFDKIFSDDRFIDYRDDIESLLMNSYNRIDASNEDRKVYIYLIKLYLPYFSETNKGLASDIIKDAPALPNVAIPPGLNRPITAKLYFTSTEGGSELQWFYNTINYFKKNGFTEKQIIENKEYELSRASGTRIIIRRISGDPSYSDDQDLVNSFNNPNIQIISNRGHCYDIKKCFCPLIRNIKPEKLFYLGSCWSYKDANIIQPNFPEAYIVADISRGEGEVNNAATLCIINRLEQGYTSWRKIEEDCLTSNPLLRDKGLVFPDNPMFAYYKFLESYPEAVG